MSLVRDCTAHVVEIILTKYLDISYTANAESLATQGAGASAAMIELLCSEYSVPCTVNDRVFPGS